MRLTSEQTKRIMECIAKEMGISLGEEFLFTTADKLFKITQSGLVSDQGTPRIDYVLPYIISGRGDFEKVPWEPKIGDVYFYPTPVWNDGINEAVYRGNNVDQNLINNAMNYLNQNMKQPFVEKGGEWSDI